MSTDPFDASTTFDVVHEPTPPETLLAGFSEFGLAGLTAVHYLVDQLDLEETGHITAENLPSIAPFSGGVSRHHTRLLSRSDFDLTVLVSELFVPLGATARSRARSSIGPNGTTSRRSASFQVFRSPTAPTPSGRFISRPTTTGRNASMGSTVTTRCNRWATAISVA